MALILRPCHTLQCYHITFTQCILYRLIYSRKKMKAKCYGVEQ